MNEHPSALVHSGAELAELAVTLSTTTGCVAIVTDTAEANLRWAGNSLTTNGQMRRFTMVVIAIADVAATAEGDAGTAAVSVRGAVTGPDDVAVLVRAAEAGVRGTGPAEDAQPLLTPEQTGTSPDFAHASPGTTIEVFSTFAPALGRAFAQARDEGVELFGFAEHTVATTWIATSTGVRLRHVQPTGRIELNAKSPDFARSAWVGQGTVDFADVDAEALYEQVRTRYGWSANTVALPAGRYETILPPSAIADLLIYAIWSASAREAEEGRSVFAAKGGGTRIGERLSALPLTLSSDPSYPGIEAAPFAIAAASGGGMESVFDNGLPLRKVDWVRDGILTELVRTRATAVGRDDVPAATDNLILTGDGTADLDDMIAHTERGLLLTCLWYIREVDPEQLLLTGLTRDGVYLIEHGKVVGAVNNFRFNESPVGLLGRISEVSREERTLPREWNDWFTRTVMPAVRVPDFNMSTVSQAS